MKINKHQEKMIEYAVQALEEDVQTRFRDVKCKKERSMFKVIKKYSEEIVFGLFALMLVGFTLDNLNTSKAMEIPNDRSPAVVEMFMGNNK